MQKHAAPKNIYKCWDSSSCFKISRPCCVLPQTGNESHFAKLWPSVCIKEWCKSCLTGCMSKESISAFNLSMKMTQLRLLGFSKSNAEARSKKGTSRILMSCLPLQFTKASLECSSQRILGIVTLNSHPYLHQHSQSNAKTQHCLSAGMTQTEQLCKDVAEYVFRNSRLDITPSTVNHLAGAWH